MKEAIGTMIRAVLKIGGGALVAKGIADEGQVEAVIGAIVTIVGVIWGIVEAKKSATARQDAQP